MEINFAKINQAKAIAEIQVHSWQHAYKNILPVEFLTQLSISEGETLWQQVIQSNNTHLLTAQINNTPVGYICFSKSRDQDAKPNQAEISALYLHSDHWHKGIGTRLWLAAKQQLLELNFTAVSLWVFTENSSAINFYSSLGFTAESTKVQNLQIADTTVTETRYNMLLTD